jgi:hypothetical protein
MPAARYFNNPKSKIRNRKIPHSPSGLFCAPVDRTSKMFAN